MSAERDFRSLADDEDPGARIGEVAPWVHEAANPYLDWMLGSPERARAAIERWMARPTSEIALGRTVGLWLDGTVIGGYVALSGAELPRAARADTLALLTIVPGSDRALLRERASALSDLRLAVEPDQWFLTKLGVLAAHRGAGHGRAAVEDFLASGRERGMRRFRLDAWEPDGHVVALYESVGFRTVRRAESADLGGALLAMTRED